MAKSKNGALMEHFAFYASYHSNPINQLIHVVCVPLILVSAFVFLTYAPASYIINDVLPAALVKGVTATVPAFANHLAPNGLNLGVLVALGYSVYYLYLSPTLLGLSAALLVLAEFVGAQYWRQSAGGDAWRSALVAHLVSWVAQFYGHGVHEGRSPALLDNLFQALFMAPLFVYMETLFFFGFLTDFQGEVAPLVRARMNAWKANKASTASKLE